MRVTAAANLLRGTPEEVVATLADWIQRVGGDPSGDASIALDAVGMALTEPNRIDYQQRAGLYAAAREADLEHVALIFLELLPRSENATLQKEAAAERRLAPNGRPLALGERKSAARGNDRQLLAKLLSDPHPSVVEILLDNPHITEKDALVVASRRPALPESLTAVYRSKRFRTRHPVRRAIVLNPHSPIAVAARIIVTMRAKDIRDVADDRSLSVPLRLHARAVLQALEQTKNRDS